MGLGRLTAALTLRGKGLLAVGLGLAVGAVLSGQLDLMRIAVLLLALPLVTLLWVSRRSFRLGCVRTLTPSRLEVGQAGEVTTRITNLSTTNFGRTDIGGLLVEDGVPAALGRTAYGVLTRLRSKESTDLVYPVHATQRGEWQVGPLGVTAVDPFGLVRLRRTFQSRYRVLVLPSVVTLPGGGLRAEHRGFGESSMSMLAARGNDDLVPREYHHGDDLRRIHWRASARTGQLMVRREEQPWTRHATVVMDLCASAHAGMGPWSSFETAVSLAASTSIALLRNGFEVRLCSSDGTTLLSSLTGVEGEFQLLNALAVITTQPTSTVAIGTFHADLIVSISTARRGTDELLEHQAPRGRGDLGISLILDTAAWGCNDALSATEVNLAAQRGAWRTAVIPARERAVESLAQLWPQLLGSTAQAPGGVRS